MVSCGKESKWKNQGNKVLIWAKIFVCQINEELNLEFRNTSNDPVYRSVWVNTFPKRPVSVLVLQKNQLLVPET